MGYHLLKGHGKFLPKDNGKISKGSWKIIKKGSSENISKGSWEIITKGSWENIFIGSWEIILFWIEVINLVEN